MDGFGRDNLPYGVARLPGGATTCVSALDGDVIDLATLAEGGAFDGVAGLVPGVLATPSLNRFLACGRAAWSGVRHRLGELIDAGDERLAVGLGAPGSPSRTSSWSCPSMSGTSWTSPHPSTTPSTWPASSGPAPIPSGTTGGPSRAGYHSRTGSIVASGTGVTRPHGRVAAGVRPTAALDIEAEIGFVVGAGNTLGEPIPEAAAADHVAGVVLINDWSARDFQSFESQPLGPFLGKSFATSMSPWLVTLDALEPYRVPGGGGYDIQIEIELAAAGGPGGPVTISCPQFSTMFWTIPQLLAHATLNGALTRPGDLFGCGTTSGPDPWTEGSLIELTWDGEHPLELPNGDSRSYLRDGDTVTLRGWAGGDGRPLLSLGDVTGTVLPARPLEV